MPVLVHRAFVLERDDLDPVIPVLSSDVETFVAVFHDAISHQAPLLRWLVFERHHLDLIAGI